MLFLGPNMEGKGAGCLTVQDGTFPDSLKDNLAFLLLEKSSGKRGQERTSFPSSGNFCPEEEATL